MPGDHQKTVVNSWNEWDALKHIIVGRADGTMVQAPEPATQRNWPKDGFPLGTFGPLPEEMVEKASMQLDNLARVLEQHGVKVDRPTLLDFSQTVQTPDWFQESMFGAMPPRDLLLTVGNEILEATMSQRSRWFEYLCYRPLLERYYKEDPNFRWEAAPKPRLTDRSFRKEFWTKFEMQTEDEQMQHTLRKEWGLTEVEPLFDAADVGRFGKDLFIQRSTVTNAAGIDWLRRHYTNHRVHEVSFEDPSPAHIDATFLPLRTGLALINRKRPSLTPQLGELFDKNGWEIVESAEPSQNKKAKLSFCSVWLSMNILMLDEKTVIVEEQENYQMEQLDRLGFNVIPVPFWDVSPFGGGLHCATVDINRQGKLEDYFPKQISGF